MNVKILTLVIVLLVSLLCSASAGLIMASTEHGTALEEAGGVRRLVQQNPAGAARATDQPAGRGDAHDPVSPTRAPCRSRAKHCFDCPPPRSDFYALPLPWGPCNEGAYACPA